MFLKFSLTFLPFVFLSLLPRKNFVVYYLLKKLLIVEQANVQSLGKEAVSFQDVKEIFKSDLK